jgi:cytochrome P450
LPAGVTVVVSIINIHAREDLYPDPERFRPERFLDRQYTPCEFVPFGGGTRRCLGAAFALTEMKLALAALLRGRHLRLADARPVRWMRRGITLGPSEFALIDDEPRSGT